jgi:DegV family protein with EDD domain
VEAGANLDKALEVAHSAVSRSHLIAYFDTLKYLAKGGRIGKAENMLGSLLSVKPILTVKEGEMAPLTRVRSVNAGLDYMYNTVADLPGVAGIAVEHATTPEQAEKLVERLRELFPNERIYQSIISPVVGTYGGPGAMAVSFLEAEKG